MGMGHGAWGMGHGHWASWGMGHWAWKEFYLDIKRVSKIEIFNSHCPLPNAHCPLPIALFLKKLSIDSIAT